MFIIYIGHVPTTTIQLCTGPTDIWAQFLLPPAPWTSGRLSGDPELSFNGLNHDAADAIVLDSCEIFVAGYVFWYTGVYGNSEYSRVFSVSSNGGGSYTTLADFYPYQAGTQVAAYDPLYWVNQINSVALAKNGNTVYVLHNTADNNQYPQSGGYSGETLKNLLITSVTTDLGTTWTHNVSNTNQISTTEAIYTQIGLFHVGGDTKTNLERGEYQANLYVSRSVDAGQTWNTTLALDNTQAYAVSDYGYSRLVTSVANVNNRCGILVNGWNTSTGNSVIYYLNPTSDITWDIKSLYDHDASDSDYYFYNESSTTYNRVKLLSLKSQPGTVLAFYGDYGSKIHRLRSTDSGNTWGAVTQVYPITVFDEITPDVTLTRINWGPLINTKLEGYPSWSTSPLGTEWNSDGWTDLSDVTTRTYGTFYDVAGGGVGQVGNYIKTLDLVMHTTDSDRYFKFKFTNWGNGSTGASFVYSRREIDTAGNNISGVVTVTKPVTETIFDIDIVGWGPNYDVVELADGNVVVVFAAGVPVDNYSYNFDAIKYVISSDGGNTFNQHGWATTATEYGYNFSDKFMNYGYKALASGNDVVLVGATFNVNNAIRFTPVAGTVAPQQPPVPMTSSLILENDPSWSNTVSLMLTGPLNVLVDWGDNSSNVYFFTSSGSTTISHDYQANLTPKIISIRGKATSIEVNSTSITSLKEWGNLINLNSLSFSGCTHLTSVPPNLYANITSLELMFNGCTIFNDANVSVWDTSNVTNLRRTFAAAPAFNQNIGTWNTGNVTTILEMFENSTAFNQNIGSWDTSNVVNMGGVFQLSAFNQNIGSWNTGNVTNMYAMFTQTPFNQNIGNWNTANVTSMSYMFSSATTFNQDLSGWCVTNISTEPEGFDANTPAWVKTGRQPVWGTCPGAPVPVTDPFELVWNLPPRPGGYILNVEVSGNTYLNIDWGDGNVETYVNPPGMTPMHTYSNAGGIYTVSIIGQTESIKFYGSTIMPHLTEVTSFGNLINLTSLWDCFPDASNLIIVPNTLPSSLSNLQNMFGGCTSLNDANIILWDTSNVTNMNSMFFNATSFNQPIGSWNTGNVSNMNGMFNNATSFNQNLSGWCVTNIPSEPTGFATGSALTGGNKPVWGTCP